MSTTPAPMTTPTQCPPNSVAVAPSEQKSNVTGAADLKGDKNPPHTTHTSTAHASIGKLVRGRQGNSAGWERAGWWEGERKTGLW